MFTIVDFLLFCLGVCIGLSSAFLGVGGGVIIVPLLPLFIPIGAVETMATSLFVVMVTVFVNSFSFIRKKLVDWPCFLYIAVGSVCFSVLLSYIGVQGADIIFRLGLVLALLVVLFNPLSYFNFKRSGMKQIILGSFGGCLTGISGVGSAIFSPILFHFQWLDKKSIVPTVNVVMCVTTVATLISLFLGHPKGVGLLHLNASGFILLGSFLSSFAGRYFNLGPYERSRRFWLKLLVFCLLVKVLFELAVYFLRG